MDSSTSAAHRRVGAAAVLAFLALLLLGLTRNSASADPLTPAATPTVRPEQRLPQEQVPPFAHPGDRDGFRHGGADGGGGFRGGGDPGGGSGGGQTAPAPSTGGGTGTTT